MLYFAFYIFTFGWIVSSSALTEEEIALQYVSTKKLKSASAQSAAKPETIFTEEKPKQEDDKPSISDKLHTLNEIVGGDPSIPILQRLQKINQILN